LLIIKVKNEKLEVKQELIKVEQQPGTPPRRKNIQSSMQRFFSPVPKQEQSSPMPADSQDSPMPSATLASSSPTTAATREQHSREQFVAWGKKGGRPKKKECRFTGQSPQQQYQARKEIAKNVASPLQKSTDATARVTIVEYMKSRRHEFGPGEQEESAWLMACRKEKFSQYSTSNLRRMLHTNERDSSGNAVHQPKLCMDAFIQNNVKLKGLCLSWKVVQNSCLHQNKNPPSRQEVNNLMPGRGFLVVVPATILDHPPREAKTIKFQRVL
jgi:hypothetical protein